MNPKQVRIIVVAIVLLAAVSGFVLFRNDLMGLFTPKIDQSVKKESVIPVDRKNLACPLYPSDCKFATIYSTQINNISLSQLGFYNVASASPILAVFDGNLEMTSFQYENEKMALLRNGDLMADYRFIGQFPSKLKSGDVKKGTVIGFANRRISFYDKKYNFILSIWDTAKKSPKNIEFNQNNESIKIID